MPLQKALLQYNFTKGVDSKTDSKLLEGNLTQLDNGIFSETGAVTRRGGHTQTADLSASVAVGTSSGTRLYKHNDQLLLHDGLFLNGYSTGIGNVTSYGLHAPALLKRRRLVRQSSSQFNADQAALGGMVLLAWEDKDATTVTMKFAVYEEATGIFHLAPTTIASGRQPRCLAFSTKLALVYQDGANIKLITVLPATPTTYTAVGNLATNGDSTGANMRLDAFVPFNGTTAVVAYNGSAASGVRMATFDSSGAVANTGNPGGTITGVGFHVARFSSNGNYLVLWDDTNVVKYAVVSSTLGAVAAASTLVSAASVGITSLDLGALKVFVGSSSPGPKTFAASIDSAGAITVAAATYMQGAYPASRVFNPGYAGISIAMVKAGTSIQNTVVLAEATSTPPAYFWGACLHASSKTPQSAVTGAGTRIPSARQKTSSPVAFEHSVLLLSEVGRLIITEGFEQTPAGISEIEVDFDYATFDVERNNLAPVKFGPNLYFPGSVLRQFDGKDICEAGFLFYPEEISNVAESNAAGTLTLLGAYEWCVVYEYVDAAGQLHRSAPSIPTSFTLTGANDTATLTIPTLHVTEKEVGIAVYRTESNGTTFYRVNAPNTLKNDATALTVSYLDTTPDSSLVTGEILYTTGGELENIVPQASIFAHGHLGRLFLVNAEDRTTISYSNEYEEGYGPVFSDELELRCGSDGGDIVGIASLDDKLILLRENQIQFIGGEGPDTTGAQNSFTRPQYITSVTGCVSPASIVQTPDGVMFKGLRGLYLLDRSLQLTWIGESVESLTGRIATATVIPHLGQVRFLCPDASTPRTLVYDYTYQQWSSIVGVTVDSYLAVNTTIYALTRAVKLWTESASATGDNGTAFTMTVETPWFKVAGIQGLQRIWRALLLGNYEAASTLTIQIAYDYATSYAVTVTVATTTLTGNTVGPFQLRHHLATQKCEAIRFKISCNGISSGSTPSLGCSLTNLSMEAGMKRGGVKLSSTKTI